jgi:hypothetical protein
MANLSGILARISGWRQCSDSGLTGLHDSQAGSARLRRMLSKRRLRTCQLLQGNFEANLQRRRHLLQVANSCVWSPSWITEVRADQEYQVNGGLLDS